MLPSLGTPVPDNLLHAGCGSPMRSIPALEPLLTAARAKGHRHDGELAIISRRRVQTITVGAVHAVMGIHSTT